MGGLWACTKVPNFQVGSPKMVLGKFNGWGLGLLIKSQAVLETLKFFVLVLSNMFLPNKGLQKLNAILSF